MEAAWRDASHMAPTLTERDVPDHLHPDHDATSTITPYTHSLNGVNQPMNMLLKDALWWTLGIFALFILVVRLGENGWGQVRLISAMSVPREKQRYWKRAQWEWMPWLKKNITYAPLWKKRHNREIQLSSAVQIGTLPSRLHFIILFVYAASNFIYMFLLNWANENRYAFCAELRGRSGTLSLTNMIPLIIFAGRNNPLITMLKISFDTYNLFHRWIGRLCVVEIVLHAIAWTIPVVAADGWRGVWLRNKTDLFIGSGTVGTIAMVIIVIWSVSPLRHAFYETFLNVHIILAFIAFICSILHCVASPLPGGLPQLPWMVAIMLIWFADRFARMVRLAYVNWSIKKGCTTAFIEPMPCNATRVTLTLPKRVNIKPGTHAYLRFWGIRAWESHPFSIAWVQHTSDDDKLPTAEKDALAALNPDGKTRVTFVIGAQSGMTRQLFDTAKANGPMIIKAAMEGPYAGHHSMDSYGHAVLFAGATGITHQLSYIRHLLEGYNGGTVATRRITLVWIIRSHEMLDWVRPMMDQILRIPYRSQILRIQIFITRPSGPQDISSGSNTVHMFPGRPNIPLLLAKEVQEQIGAMCVSVCGPGALADDVRGAVRAVQGDSVVSFVEESFTW